MAWFCFKWSLLAGIVCAVVALWYFRDTLDNEIRDQVQSTLAAHFDQLEVRVQEAERLEGKGLLIRGLSLSQRDARGPLSELAFFEEVFLACRTDLQDLISGDLDVRHVSIRRATVRATRRPDGSYSTDTLLPIPQLGPAKAVTHIENGTLIVFDPLKNPSSTLTLRDINLVITPGATAAEGAGLQPSHRLEGSLSGDHFGRTEVQGWFDELSRRWSVGGRVHDLSLSPELSKSLPGNSGNWLRPLEPFRGNVALSFRADADPARQPHYHFDVRGTLSRGRIDDQRLPYPLTDVSGTVRLDQNGYKIENMTARSGRTVLSLTGRQNGYGPGSHLLLEGRGQRVVLDQQMVQAMPPHWQEIWHKYQPAGEVNADVKLEFDGERWRPEFIVECADAAFTHHRFPYRMQHTSGRITLKDDVMNVRLLAYAGSQPVRIEAEITRPGPQGIGYLVARTENLPLDERFYQALTEKTRRIVKAFAPQGSINGYVRVKRNRPDARWEHHFVIDLNNIGIKYEKFAYPLRDVRGRLEAVNRHWTFHNLVGTNDTGIVTASGQSVPVQEGHQLTIRINGNNVPLDEELRKCLPPRMQQVWTRLRPRGSVSLDAQLSYDSWKKDLDMTVRTAMQDDGILIEPDFFPYRLENVRGHATFRPGHVQLTNITATHGRTRWASQGACQIGQDGSWECRLHNLTADHLHIDRDLLLAMPPKLRSGLASLNFSGPLNLAGGIRFSQAAAAHAPLQTSWDMQLNTLQGRIDCGIVLDQVSGGLRLVGGYDGQQFRSHGWLDVDSLLYKGFQFTKVQGPCWFGEDQIIFGAGVQPQRPGEPPQRITAWAYDGALAADCQIALGDTTRFLLDAQAVDGDLNRFATEALHGSTELAGKVTANLRLRGSNRGIHTLQGSGNAVVKNGDVDQLPLVLSLLKFLSETPSQRKRFDNSDVKFRIDGSHILLDEINFYGDAISLRGKGEMDLDRHIRMVFHATVGRDRGKLPVVGPVLGMASKQLMLIYVHGTIDNPQTTREALPGLRRAVQEIETGLTEPNQDKSMLRKTQDWFDAVRPKSPLRSAEQP
ncbi:MAG: hypothetical protein GTO62_12240 [Planctomycetales bacterium]|nr:hypothetical protein [Planctomycetales bacterium]NIN77847.1 hypothetical protein [Planctomycetales bacterium]NIP70012.1 hypothetical protein [Planctomycetales bacterium]